MEAYLLSHIKAPLREEKREVASYLGRNIATLNTRCKKPEFFSAFLYAICLSAGYQAGGMLQRHQRRFLPAAGNQAQFSP